MINTMKSSAHLMLGSLQTMKQQTKDQLIVFLKQLILREESRRWLNKSLVSEFRRGSVRISPLTRDADRYSPLPHFGQQTRFLLTVQLPLLEQYHARIASSLDAFESLSSALVRAVPGALGVSLGSSGPESGVKVDTKRLTGGVDGVQRLCKALVSANFMEAAMETWGEELVSNFPIFSDCQLTSLGAVFP
jgi:hypothetical protein